MSAGVLKYTLVVRNPDTMVATVLKAGEPVPEWAQDHVHPDDLDGATDEAPTEPEDGPEEDPAKPYGQWSKAELAAEVEKRNEGRDEDDLIEVEAPGNKAELVAALQGDDAAQAE